MIRLFRNPPPPELKAEDVEKLTQDYMAGKADDVWKKAYIKRDLLIMSHNKCAYCECMLEEESKYTEIEHFHPKSIYQELVLDWDNLLPSCKRCNIKKLDHDTKKEAIIHPCKDEPKEHLFMRDYRYYGKTVLGESTKDVLYLNDFQYLIQKRFKVGNDICEQLEDLTDIAKDYFNGINQKTNRKNRIVNKFKAILRECCPETNYSATAATILFQDKNFTFLKDNFSKFALWDDELEFLKNKAWSVHLIP